MPRITLIAICDENLLIAVNGQLPWHFQEDLAYFKNKTTGHTVVMGRKTYESLPEKKPLAGRTNIILSKTMDKPPNGFLWAPMSGILALQDDIFVIGGGEIYKEFLPHADQIILTLVKEKIPRSGECVYFPEICDSEWKTELLSYHHHYNRLRLTRRNYHG